MAKILKEICLSPNIYKKVDKKECVNYRTIALISHASEIFLRIKDYNISS